MKETYSGFFVHVLWLGYLHGFGRTKAKKRGRARTYPTEGEQNANHGIASAAFLKQ